MNALGVYIFAGGFTHGVKQAGFDILAHLEDGEYGVATSELNHPGLSVHTTPYEWPGFVEDVDLIYANPPCAIWSQAGAGYIKGRLNTRLGFTEDDPRIHCVLKTFELLERHRPKVWVWESVAGAFKRGRPFIDVLAARAAELGYACSLVLHNGVDIGIAQSRKRVFIVFHRIAIKWVDPRGRYPYLTVRDVIGNLDDPGDWSLTGQRMINRLGPYAKQGERLHDVWMRRHPQRLKTMRTDIERFGGKVKGRPGYLPVRIAWDRYANTATGSPMLIHPDENRNLSLLEVQLLCGYPDWYEFVGTLGQCYAQCCQAVMPPAGRWLAEQVYDALERDERLGPGYCTAVVDFMKGGS